MPTSTCKQLILENLQTVIKYSGFHFNGYGEFRDCLDLSPKFIYNFINIKTSNVNGMPGQIQTVMGLCLPRKCSKEQIKNQANFIFKNIRLNSTVQSISNYYPKNLQLQINWTAYLVLAIFLLTISLSLYATIMVYLNKQTKFKMFSFQSTKIYFKRNPKSSLNVFNGVKSVAMVWIIFIHSTLGNFKYLINSMNKQNLSQSTFYLLGIRGEMAVATFFFIGGFLTCFTTLKQDWKSIWKALTNIIYRALRIWPTYLFIIMMYYSNAIHLIKGPNYPSKGKLPSCENIFKIIFFVENLFGQQCFSYAWYLDVDMQIFSISMLLLLLYKNYKKLGKIMLVLISGVFFIQVFIYSYSHNVKIRVDIKSAEYQYNWHMDQYLKPWLWIPIYFLGIFMAILYHQYLQQAKLKNKLVFQQIKPKDINQNQGFFSICHQSFQKSKCLRVSTEILGIIIMNFIVFIPTMIQLGSQWPIIIHSLYMTFSLFIFVFGLCITILPTLLGCKTSLVKLLMDNEIFNFITKISFATYLVHKFFVWIWYTEQNYNTYYSQTTRFVQFVAIAVSSIIGGFIITILIQAPFMNINKELRKYLKKEKKKNEIQKQQISQTTEMQLQSFQNSRLQQTNSLKPCD